MPKSIQKDLKFTHHRGTEDTESFVFGFALLLADEMFLSDLCVSAVNRNVEHKCSHILRARIIYSPSNSVSASTTRAWSTSVNSV